MLRRVAVLVIALGSLGGAGARAEPCNAIRLVSARDPVFVDAGDTGCAAGADTDLVLPGVSHVVVRWMAPEAPRGPSRIEFAGITGPLSYCTPAGRCDLAWRGVGFGGDLAYWESQRMSVSAAGTATGGRARITVCRTDATDCLERSYRTVVS